MEQRITEQALSEQVRRLRSIPFKPEDEDQVTAAANEIKAVLRKAAYSDDHLRRIMDCVIQEGVKTFPAPATIAEIAREVSEVNGSGSPTGCDACACTGYVVVERKAFNRGTQRVEAVTAADYCECARGQWLRSKSEERSMVEKQ